MWRLRQRELRQLEVAADQLRYGRWLQAQPLRAWLMWAKDSRRHKVRALPLAVFYIVTGEQFKQSAELTGGPIKMKG